MNEFDKLIEAIKEESNSFRSFGDVFESMIKNHCSMAIAEKESYEDAEDWHNKRYNRLVKKFDALEKEKEMVDFAAFFMISFVIAGVLILNII